MYSDFNKNDSDEFKFVLNLDTHEEFISDLLIGDCVNDNEFFSNDFS
jgi:hypothetical protein